MIPFTSHSSRGNISASGPSQMIEDDVRHTKAKTVIDGFAASTDVEASRLYIAL